MCLFKANNITVVSNIKCAFLLHSDKDHYSEKIYNDTQTKYLVTLDTLNEHFIQKRNLEYDLIFRAWKQKNDETVYQYHTILLHLSKYCKFVDLNCELKTQVIYGCLSCRVRRKALLEPDFTLNDILTYGVP